MKTIRATNHQADPECFELDESGFYVPRCQCGWSFGPVPDMETMVDCLMGHAVEATIATIPDGY